MTHFSSFYIRTQHFVSASLNLVSAIKMAPFRLPYPSIYTTVLHLACLFDAWRLAA